MPPQGKWETTDLNTTRYSFARCFARRNRPFLAVTPLFHKVVMDFPPHFVKPEAQLLPMETLKGEVSLPKCSWSFLINFCPK